MIFFFLLLSSLNPSRSRFTDSVRESFLRQTLKPGSETVMRLNAAAPLRASGGEQLLIGAECVCTKIRRMAGERGAATEPDECCIFYSISFSNQLQFDYSGRGQRNQPPVLLFLLNLLQKRLSPSECFLLGCSDPSGPPERCCDSAYRSCFCDDG